MEIQRPISSLNANVNRSLKQIGTLIDQSSPLSVHNSRHSFADFARRKGMGSVLHQPGPGTLGLEDDL